MHTDWTIYIDETKNDKKRNDVKVTDLKTKEEIYNYYLSGGMKKMYMIVQKIITHLGYPFTEFVIEDLEEIALICLWKSAEKFDYGVCDNFEAYYVENLKKKFFSYSKKMMGRTKRMKKDSDGNKSYVLVKESRRVGFQNMMSIDEVIFNDKEKEITIGDTLMSDFNVHNEVFSDQTDEAELLSEIKQGLSKTGKKIIELIAYGYEPVNICEMLGITRENYNHAINNITKYADTRDRIHKILESKTGQTVCFAK